MNVQEQTMFTLFDDLSYSTTASVFGENLTLSFTWNQRLNCRVLNISNNRNEVVLQNTILRPYEPYFLSLISSPEFSCTMILMPLKSTGIGNMKEWSKDYCLTFTRVLPIEE